ncbi:MAG TPA: 23S rRNA (guanosine(2251)-2'-O)-methyltransferase RlmB [Candidatus Binatia bacterium]|nr:23S rRNA (guanosine(2251)-2'-O)-methyltransferase RlmB [Candidatus Binatia bacterium]
MPHDVVWGRNPVRALLRARGRRVDEVALLAGAAGPLAEIVALARQAGVKVSYRTRDQLTAIAGSAHHQGVVARVAAAEYVPLGDLLAVPAARGEPAFFLAVDQVQDPRNLGALLRTADAFGVHGVLLPRHRQVGLTGAAARTAMGAAESVPVAREANLADALDVLKRSGVWVFGAVPEGGLRPWEGDLTGPLCLVLGSEGEGLRPRVARTCDVLLTVPMLGRVGSLNVAAAGAVLCYEVTRQRALRRKTP